MKQQLFLPSFGEKKNKKNEREREREKKEEKNIDVARTAK